MLAVAFILAGVVLGVIVGVQIERSRMAIPGPPAKLPDWARREITTLRLMVGAHDEAAREAVRILDRGQHGKVLSAYTRALTARVARIAERPDVGGDGIRRGDAPDATPFEDPTIDSRREP